MNRPDLRATALAAMTLMAFLSFGAERPNVLFLAVDDMNDWTSVLKGYGGEVHTPNIERLAKMGVSFVNAQTASPLCCPSRAAIMLGKRPSTTGIYDNGHWWRPHMHQEGSCEMGNGSLGATRPRQGRLSIRSGNIHVDAQVA